MPTPLLALALSLMLARNLEGPPLEQLERVEAMEVNLTATSGALVARSVVLGGGERRVEFGTKRCPERPALEIIEWLREAMRGKEPVTLQTRGLEASDSSLACLKGVVFFAR